MICRICHSKNLVKFLNLGFAPPADDFLTEDELNESEIYYPLEVFICKNCSLVQLGHVVPPHILFQKNYPYVSSTTKTFVKHFHSFAKEVLKRFDLKPKDVVVDIGSNVGLLLNGFKNEKLDVIGVEPAENICKIAIKNGIETINDFFDIDTVEKIIKMKGKAKIITGTNVFAHINDIHSVVRNVKELLDNRGVFIIEAPYLVKLIEDMKYDTIYHEHLSYLSLKPLVKLFDIFGMDIFDVEEIDFHGGSLRYFVARKNDYPISKNVKILIELEEKKKIHELKTLEKFSKEVEKNREKLIWLLKSLKREGNSIAAVSAPAKGMTLLNYCKIGTDILDFITEKAPLKIGKYTPGTHIPVVPDSELVEKKPDYALLLAWNLADEIIKNLEDYRKTGGKFIIPIPKPHII